MLTCSVLKQETLSTTLPLTMQPFTGKGPITLKVRVIVFLVIKLYKFCESIKTLNQQRNAHSQYSESVSFKGALYSFGEEIQTHKSNIYTINEMIRQTGKLGPQNTI